MKKFLSLFAIAFALLATDTLSGQSTTLRCGSGSSYDPAQLNYIKATVTEATGYDTVAIKSTNAFITYIVFSTTLKDSCAMKFSGITNCHLGDEVIIQVTNSSGSGHYIKFIGTNNVETASGTTKVSLASAKTANIIFIFNGTLWVEESRSVE